MRSIFLLYTLLLSFGLFAQNLQKSGGPLKPVQANMDIRHYTLSLQVDPVTQSYKGFTEIALKLSASSSEMLFDLTDNFTVGGVQVDGKKVPFTHSGGLVNIKAPSAFASGDHKVKIEYGGKPVIAVRAPWDGGIQWSKDSLGRPWIAMSCQEDGADIFFPCKDHPSDEPNEGADLFITVPKGLVVAGPGLLVKSSTSGKTSLYHWKTNYTINTYSIVFNVGNYVVARKTFNSSSGSKTPMEFYVLDYNRGKADKHLELLERSAQFLEKYFGEYPWAKEKIGIAETPHLGMEHQTMNAYGNKFKYVKLGEVDFDWLLTHEFGHEWWGNKITNIDWAHMWIHEGICSFADALFAEAYGGRKVYLDRMTENATKFGNKLPIVQGEMIDSRQTYQLDIYTKGAFFMHTLRYVLGDSLFFPTLKGFATDPKFTYDNLVTTESVLLYFNSATRKDLRPLFRLFLYSTDKLQVYLKHTALNAYTVELQNLDMSVPMEILTSTGKIKITASKTPVKFQSETMPIIDPDGYYLKKLIAE